MTPRHRPHLPPPPSAGPEESPLGLSGGSLEEEGRKETRRGRKRKKRRMGKDFKNEKNLSLM